MLSLQDNMSIGGKSGQIISFCLILIIPENLTDFGVSSIISSNCYFTCVHHTNG